MAAAVGYRGRVTPLLSIHLAVLLFGAAGLFGKLVALPPTVIVLGRVVFAAAVLAPLVWVRDRRTREGRMRDRRVHDGRMNDGRARDGRIRDGHGRDALRKRPLRDRIALAGLGLLLAVHWVTFFHAIQVSSVAVGLVTFATFPVFTALLEPLLPGERLDRGALVAAALTVVGVGLVVPTPDLADAVTQGALWGVVSGFTFALLSLANRAWVRRESALRLALHQDAWAAVFLAPFALAAPRLPTATEWGLLALLGVVFTAGAHALFIRGLRRVSASRASVITALEPVYGVALAFALLGERPAARTLAGGALVLVVAGWISWRGEKAPQ